MTSFEDDLRRALDAEAATVDVRAGALLEIRRRVSARRARWFRRGGAMIVFTSGAAALATVAALVAGVGSCAPTRPPAPNPPVVQPSAGSSTAAPAPSTTGAPQPGATALLRIYYLGSDRGRPRLYPEFHSLPVGDGSAAARTRTALTEMLDGRRAYDPDYASGWPAGTRVRDVRIEGDAVVVDLTGFVNGTGPGQLDPDTVRQAVQQLVWTATARGTSGRDVVRLRLDGRPVSTLWGIAPVSSDLRRAPAVDVLGLIWVIDPQQGATVGRTFQVYVAGIVFEATVQVRIKRGGTVVHERTLTLDAGPPEQGEARFSLTLQPGSYTIEGYAISAADGSEQHLDDHTFTVR